jgi:hypothetical protein
LIGFALISRGYGWTQQLPWADIEQIVGGSTGAVVRLKNGQRRRLPALTAPPYYGHAKALADISAFTALLNARHG